MKREESPRFYLTSYTPLVRTEAGRIASVKHRLRPFIDGSIRREPDLEHEGPAISCLCRAGKFAPRLMAGDFVAYMTIKGDWHGPDGVRLPRHRRLTAILRVEVICDSHEEAARWYRKRELKLPSNCMVAGNPPKPLELSHRMTRFRCAMSDGKLHKTWDAAYMQRAKFFGRVVICKAVFRSLGWEAPIVRDRDLKDVFGVVPGTQNPGAQRIEFLNCLLSQLRLGTIGRGMLTQIPCDNSLSQVSRV